LVGFWNMLRASLLLHFLAKEKTIALLRLLRDGLIVFLSFLLWNVGTPLQSYPLFLGLRDGLSR
jgi:hypothetical protein